MSELTADGIKQAFEDAGFEIYQSRGTRIQLAERVRLHLMDSGVAIETEPSPSVSFAVRTQRSDFPTATPEELFDKVRGLIAAQAAARGFAELEARSRAVTNPVDEADVLDVWHELVYQKSALDLEALISDVRWALDLPKCVT